MAKRVHTAEFKRQAVRLAAKPGVSRRPSETSARRRARGITRTRHTGVSSLEFRPGFAVYQDPMSVDTASSRPPLPPTARARRPRAALCPTHPPQLCRTLLRPGTEPFTEIGSVPHP